MQADQSVKASNSCMQRDPEAQQLTWAGIRRRRSRPGPEGGIHNCRAAGSQRAASSGRAALE